jgi:hypothetical protein
MIKAPNWAADAVPTRAGWVSGSGELLKSQKLTAGQIDEFYGNVAAPEVLIEAPVGNKSIDDMTKRELESLARSEGVELDRRESKSTLIGKVQQLFG